MDTVFLTPEGTLWGFQVRIGPQQPMLVVSDDQTDEVVRLGDLVDYVSSYPMTWIFA